MPPSLPPSISSFFRGLLHPGLWLCPKRAAVLRFPGAWAFPGSGLVFTVISRPRTSEMPK